MLVFSLWSEFVLTFVILGSHHLRTCLKLFWLCNFNCFYQAFIIGQDFGAIIAYLVAVVYPEKIASVITLGIPFINPGASAVKNDLLPKGFYITRWQVQILFHNIFILFYIPSGQYKQNEIHAYLIYIRPNIHVFFLLVFHFGVVYDNDELLSIK